MATPYLLIVALFATVLPALGPTEADLSHVQRQIRNGEYAEAEAALAALEAEHPLDSRILLLHGEVLLALKRTAEALPLLRRCTELTPDQELVHFQLATALSISGSPEAALEEYAREGEINQDPRVLRMVHLNRSLLFQHQRAWLQAAEELEAVLRLPPNGGELYGDLASVYLEADRPGDAEDSLRRGERAGFQSAPMYSRLGAGYYQIQAYQNARQAFAAALEIDPLLAEAHRGLADTLESLGLPVEALPHFKRSLELQPDSPDADRIRARIAGSGRQ